MGWFWANPPPSRPTAPHPISTPDATPPPGCPMYKASPPTTTGCPYPPSSSSPQPPPQSAPSSCPVASPSPPASEPAPSPSLSSRLNPLNLMPSLSQERAANQRIALPTGRTTSSIPRGDSPNENWQYPSPQQMYNAMIRKGHDDTPEDAVESMVEIHNFLNEGAWGEIVGWEARFGRGLKEGWRFCELGEEAGGKELEDRFTWRRGEEPRLARFMGRPGEMTPKARMLEVMGMIWPAKFAGELPFDRHDWFVQRAMPDGHRREVRYVIDYYSGPPEPTGEPVFYLDVRPAVDSPTAACERLMRWSGDVWYRASGMKVRKEAAMAEKES